MYFRVKKIFYYVIYMLIKMKEMGANVALTADDWEGRLWSKRPMYRLVVGRDFAMLARSEKKRAQLFWLQAFKASDIAFGDFVRVGEIGYGICQAVFAKQMKHGVRGAVGIVPRRMLDAIKKLVVGMKTGNLKNAPESHAL
jgi:hypothetical protein